LKCEKDYELTERKQIRKLKKEYNRVNTSFLKAIEPRFVVFIEDGAHASG